MLTHDGHVCEGSAENIFLLTKGELITPAPSENILLGITRETIMELARRELGMLTRERQVDRTELYGADELFLCGTGAQIVPVVEVDHRPISTGKVGRICRTLQQLYFEVVRGHRPQYRQQWCTPVFATVSVQQDGGLSVAPDGSDKEAKAARLKRYAELRWSPDSSLRLKEGK